MEAIARQGLNMPEDILEEDEEVIGGPDWQEKIAPYMGVNVGIEVTAENYRHMYGRPFRLLRTLAGLNEAECAKLLGWTLGEVAMAEERSDAIGCVQFLKVVQAIATLGFAVAARHDNNYMRQVWEPASGEPFETLDLEGIMDYLQFQTMGWSESSDNRLL